jgi:hypothetical protein
MGYRSTFVTDDLNLQLPEWFVEKWGKSVHMAEGNRTPIASKYEAKTYWHWLGLEEDLQRVLSEGEHPHWSIHIVFMGEDGELSKSEIFSDRIEGVHITANNQMTDPDKISTNQKP